MVTGRTNKAIAFNFVRAFFIATMLFLTSCATTGGSGPYPDYYSSKPIQGRIVDGVTGQPVAGAAVLVSWKVEYLPLWTALVAVGHSQTTKKYWLLKSRLPINTATIKYRDGAQSMQEARL